jgi:hypothetical protein
MSHKHKDYNNDYTYGGGTSTKTTTATTHPWRRTLVWAFLTPRGQMQRRPSTITPPPRTMATFDSRQFPLPLTPTLPQAALQADGASAGPLEAQDATERETKKPRLQDAHGEHALTHHTC